MLHILKISTSKYFNLHLLCNKYLLTFVFKSSSHIAYAMPHPSSKLVPKNKRERNLILNFIVSLVNF